MTGSEQQAMRNKLGWACVVGTPRANNIENGRGDLAGQKYLPKAPHQSGEAMRERDV